MGRAMGRAMVKAMLHLQDHRLHCFRILGEIVVIAHTHTHIHPTPTHTHTVEHPLPPLLRAWWTLLRCWPLIQCLQQLLSIMAKIWHQEDRPTLTKM